MPNYPHTTKKGRASLVPSFAVLRTLRREATQRASYISFTEPLERTIAKLTHALAGDAEQRANLFQSVLASTFEPEIQAKDFRIARRERRQSGFDLVVEEAIHCLLLGVRHLVGDEALDERAVAFGIHRSIQADVAGVERGERLHDIDRQACELRELLGSRLAAHLLSENLRRLDDTRQIRGPVQRNT